jgi:IS30 family transposase
MYDAKIAQKKYEELLVEAREGVALAKKDFWSIDKIVTDGIEKGQHLYHILQTHQIKQSQSTVYRWLNEGKLSASPFAFPRVVKFKPRKKKTEATPRVVRINREYKDFLAFCAKESLTSWVEMDTVEGRKGGKVLLTFTVSSSNFFFAYLMNKQTAQAVVDIFGKVRKEFKRSKLEFDTLFWVLLTDNGSEFAYADKIENDKEVNLFYCDPGRSDQKARVEKNHTLLRDILPKGTSFDELTQQDVNVICSHINGVKRKSLNGKTAYEAFTFFYGQVVPMCLNIQSVPATEVIQSTKLLNLLNKSHILTPTEII